MKNQFPFRARALSRALSSSSSSTSPPPSPSSFPLKHVTKSNFDSALHSLADHLRAADFVSIDLEMTGVTSAPWRDSFEFDRFDVRYLKVKDSAESFAVVQFGVCPFRWDPQKLSFVANPHNFFIFPRHDREFLCQTTSLDFLAKYQFDFNACIHEGVSYLSREQEGEALKRVNSVYEDESLDSLKEARDMPLVNMVDVLFTERMKNRLSEWREELLRGRKGESQFQGSSNESEQQFQTVFFKMHPALSLSGFSSHQLRLIKLVVKKHFKDLAYIHDSAENPSQQLVVYVDSESDKELLMKEVKDEQCKQEELKIKAAVGFRHVIDLLASEKKLIIGHNCFLDIAHIYSKFFGPLPLTGEEFASSINNHFPYIIDTKILLNSNIVLQQWMKKSSTSLSSAFSVLCPQIAFGSKVSHLPLQSRVKVEVELDDMRSSNWNSGAKHEAGYDAFMTGCIFAQACSHLGIDFKLHSPSENLAHNEKLQKDINCLYLSWTNGDIINLSTGDRTSESFSLKNLKIRHTKICFEHVVIIWGFQPKLKARAIRECILKVFGPASVTSVYHVDESAVFVNFSKAELVLKFLELKESLERSNDPISVLHPLAKLLEGGNTRAASYETYKEICSSPISRLLFADQAEAVGIKWKTKLVKSKVDSAQETDNMKINKLPSQLGDSYFLITDPASAGSPPRRLPPPIKVKQETNNASYSPSKRGPANSENAGTSKNDYHVNYKAAPTTPTRPAGNSGIPPLGLASLRTGMSDDDLRESAYELLLASMLFSGIEVYSVEDKKKEKSSKFLSGLKSKRDKLQLRSQSSERHLKLVDTVRVQMQISEAMDACIRRNLIQWAARRTSGQFDLPQMSLALLIGIFKSDFFNEKSYMQWKSRQTNILEELLYFSANVSTTEHLTVGTCLEKIRTTKEWDFKMSASERVEVLSSIRQVALKISSLPGQFGIQSETYYWTAGYHLNIRLYEKLLFGMFDILDECQLIEEADAIQSLIKLTWSTLGITHKMHYAIYGWVLFQQFVETAEGMLLEYAVRELQKVQSSEEDDGKEVHYMDSLICPRQYGGREFNLNLVQAIFLSINIWCDCKLQDYHQHFNQENFERVMALASTVGVLASSDSTEIKLTKLSTLNDNAARKIKRYVRRSTEAACRQVENTIDLESKVDRTHPLALLGNKLRLIAEKEFSVFWPVLRHWCYEALMISAMLLHQFYGERLKPFLKEVSCLSEDVRMVLPVAAMLDHYLTQLYTSAFQENGSHHPFNQNLDHYQIGEVCRPIILDWVIAQHSHILEWTGRALDLEDWEPLSSQQRQAASIIEVFRIIEETVDQCFGLKLPLDITHLQALLSVIFHSLDFYLQRVLNQLVEKSHLYPSTPPLTRYEETVIPVVKKKLLEFSLLDNGICTKLDELTTPKLCIRLNTLQYIKKQISLLEDGIKKFWARVGPSNAQAHAKEEPQETSESDFLTCSEALDELFVTTLHCIRDIASDSISKICDFIGARVVFWDLRDSFLSHLYRGSVERARLDIFLPQIDTVLDHICGLIDDSLRDLVVLSVYRASLEGYIWVLLDGGPSRAFSNSDVVMMEEDLNTLKELFIANGEGLPRSLVEREAKFTEEILGLFHLQSETVIQMLMSASEHISMKLDPKKHGHTHLEDANTLVRVLCHKKDREASKFLKRQYQLPISSEYDETPSDPTLRSPLKFDLFKRSASMHWSKNGHSSFKSMRRKLQKATSEFSNATWL